MAKRKELIKPVASHDDIQDALKWAGRLLTKGLEAGEAVLIVTRPRRTKDQNAKLWPMLGDISRQVEWYGELYGQDDWKNMLTAALENQRVVRGINGGFVGLGKSTSAMTKKQFCDLVELIYAFGSEHCVKWSEPTSTAEELWNR
jgi:uncharacterized protein YoaH (UPF0181 family)